MSLPDGYTAIMVQPPGLAIAPHGFPAPTLPPGASQPFLDSMAVRIAVFCEEQHCSEINELDEDDLRSFSWNIYNSAHRPVATVRLVPPPHATHPNGYINAAEEPYVKLTRFATLAQERGKGLGKALLSLALDWAGAHSREMGQEWHGMVLLHAQVSVEKMYAKMGFVTDANLGRWTEENIEHLGMWKRIAVHL